jgi:aminotransferase
MVTIGGEEAVAASIFAMLDAGDEVLIGQPCYIPYVSLVRLACAQPVLVPLLEEDGYNFDLDALEKAVTPKTRMLILNTPGNPTGTIMDREHLIKLAAFCEKRDLLVVADEAYEQVLYDGNQHITFAALPGMWERTITAQSFSKTYSMCGWRIGYAVAPAALLRVVVRAHMNMVMSSNTFSQYGALEALTGPQDSLYAMLAQFDRRRTAMYEALTGMGIPCNKPQGAFYLFPNISQFGMDSFAFAEHLLENYGVATVPGVEFGPLGEGHLRISYATSFEDCMAGVEAIRRMAEDLRAGKRPGKN